MYFSKLKIKIKILSQLKFILYRKTVFKYFNIFCFQESVAEEYAMKIFFSEFGKKSNKPVRRNLSEEGNAHANTTIHCMKSNCIRSYSGPYSVCMRENAGQNHSEYGPMSRSDD